METEIAPSRWLFIRRNPLVPAALLFLLGLTLGNYFNAQVASELIFAAGLLIAWLLAELLLFGPLRGAFTHSFLAGAIILSGAAFWNLNQHSSEPTHVARFAADTEVPITAKIRVVVPPPDDASRHGNLYWVGEVTDIFTNQGWLPSHGTVKFKWRAGPDAPDLHRGELVDVYGWLSKPPGPQNPGALDMREILARDRIFAQIRIPRTTGVSLADPGEIDHPNWISRMRLFLREKLLLHTVTQDVDAGHAMVALLLGYRDPSIDDISRNFADAGVAHLLAISGAHIVFFAGFVWTILRFLPIRPRLREFLITLCVLVYVVATPCGPPVVRAGAILILVLLTRLLGRPRMMMNMLAIALLFVVMLRPTDITSAGFQLTFISTAALILLAERVHDTLFKNWLQRKSELADLSGNRWAQRRVQFTRAISGLLVASFIGAGTATPFLMLHFGQFNPYAMLTGIIALPMVVMTMIASLLQLSLEMLSTPAAALFAPISTAVTHAMLSTIKFLAEIPGAAVSLRAPPAWLVAFLYAPIVLWIMRKSLRISRAITINFALVILITTIAWYILTAPLNKLRMQILNVGQGSSVVIRTPAGQVWLVNAGSRDQAGMLDFAIRPTLRTEGVKTIDGLLLTNLDTVHASAAAEALNAFHPPLLFTSTLDWDHRDWTFAGASIEDALNHTQQNRIGLEAGQSLNLGEGLQVQILWPPTNQPIGGLVLMWQYANQKILMLDAGGIDAANLLAVNAVDLHADTIILLGPERGARDADLRNLLVANNQNRIWSGRTIWAAKTPQPTELNSADGFVSLEIDPAGKTLITH